VAPVAVLLAEIVMNVMSAADVKNPDAHSARVSVAWNVINTRVRVRAHVPTSVQMSMVVVNVSIVQAVNVVMIAENSHVYAPLHPQNV